MVDQGHSNVKHFDFKNILPEFNPINKSQSIESWLKKVNECALVYSWDDKTTVHYAMQKLQGLAKTWYESLSTILFTWKEWEKKLLNAFPCEENYGQTLEAMLKRKSTYNEPIEIYYYEKLALLNRCDITGKRAVDCIIHGLSDRFVKSSALALRCTMPEQLLQFLLSNKEPQQYRSISKPRVNYEKARFTPRRGSGSGIICFNCKEKGLKLYKAYFKM